MIKWRHQYDQKENERMSLETAYHEQMESLTQKQFAADADINELVRRFGIDKQPIPPAVLDPSWYGEVPAELDLSWAMQTVRDAEERFRALPAPLRERFNNSPEELWDFVNDSGNADEAVALGLLVRGARGQGDATPPIPVSEPTPTPIVRPEGS